MTLTKGRRAQVDLGSAGIPVRAVLLVGPTERATTLLSAHTLTAIRKRERPMFWEGFLADPTIDGGVCYALYHKPLHQVKIGYTTALLTRWGRLEAQGGGPLQLVAVWRSRDSVSLERDLHKRFADARTPFGEWFDADPVLDYLRERVRRRQDRRR